MSIYSDSRTYFGKTTYDASDLLIVTNGFSYADEVSKLLEVLKEINQINIEKAILESEQKFFFRYALVVDLYLRANHYRNEFPLHKLSLYISTYFDVVEENIDLFTQTKEIIVHHRFKKPMFFGELSSPEVQAQTQELIAEIKEPLLNILAKLKVSFEAISFKHGIKAEQKYSSKMKLKYLEIGRKMMDSAKEMTMIEFDLHTRDFSFDNYVSGSICTVNFDAVLNDLASDRKLFVDLCWKEFSEDFCGCIWKINHNLTRGFYLSFLMLVKKERKGHSVDRLQNFLNNYVYENKNFQLIKSGSHLFSSSSSSASTLSAVSRYVMMDTIFNLKLENHKTLGCVGFKSFTTQFDCLDIN